jgi:hypothetical protein
VLLPWGDRQILQYLLAENGRIFQYLQLKNAENPFYGLFVKFFSVFMPSDFNLAVTWYASINWSIRVATTWLLILCLFSSIRFVVGYVYCNQSPKQTSGVFHSDWWVMFASSAVIIIAALPKPLSFLTGAHVAGWHFPLHQGFSPSGVSFFFAQLAIVYFFTKTCKNQIKDRSDPWVFLLLFCLSLAFHPVVPLFIILVCGLAAGIKSAYHVHSWSQNFALLCHPTLAYLGLSLIFLFIGEPAALSAEKFFNIYVVERAPHHYLPSHYANTRISLVLAGNVAVAFLIWKLCGVAGVEQKLRSAFAVWFSAGLASMIVINVIQFFAVEHLKLLTFTQLGVSRLSAIFSFTNQVVLASGILGTLTLIRQVSFCPGIIRWLRFLRHWLHKVKIKGALFFFGMIFIPGIALLNYQGLDYRPEAKLKQSLDDLNEGYPRTIIFTSDAKMEYLREVGLFSVYADYYFPFFMSQVQDWSTRIINAKAFEVCIEDKLKLEDCSGVIEGGADYLISRLQLLESAPLASIENDGGLVFLYRMPE